MSNHEGPVSGRHYFELPPGINNMTDAEIEAMAAELSKRIMSVMPDKFKKDEKGGRK